MELDKADIAPASRGGRKLEAALDRFAIDPSGRRCLDAGAGAGGFTEVLLTRGAAHVTAVDVGRGQIVWRLRTDPRVRVMERTNVRRLRIEALGDRPDLITADLSFISLSKVIPALAGVAAGLADFVLLAKPQFEAGRGEVPPGGVVVDPEVWRGVLVDVVDACHRAGVMPQGVMASPLLGTAGNVEFLFHGRLGGTEQPLGLDKAVAEGRALRT